MKNEIRNKLFTVFILVCFNLFSEEQIDATKKKTICLNMIVKNESEVIIRCLKSVLPFIDYWVIVDTGSTDQTQEIIKEFMRENKKPGELYELPWVNFGHNREEALLLAKDKADYLLFIDADDELSYSQDFVLPDLIYDIYMVEANAGWLKYHLMTLVKANQELHWKDPIHEYLEVKDAKVAAIFSRLKYIYHHDGARGKDPLTLQKDIQALNDCLEKDPKNTRYLLFLGHAYHANNEKEKALKYYTKRSEMGGCPEEVFWSLLQMAHLQRELNYNILIVKESYLRANQFRPSRPEPLFYLAYLARIEQDYQKGYEITREAIKIPTPTDTFHVEKGACDAILFEFANCAYQLSKYDESLKACNRILKRENLPEQYLNDTKNLREQVLEKRRYLKARNVINKFYKT